MTPISLWSLSFIGCSDYNFLRSSEDPAAGAAGMETPGQPSHTGSWDIPAGDTGSPASEDCIPMTVISPEEYQECKQDVDEVDDPWSIQLEWAWSQLFGYADHGHVISMPAVANITDDNGDGAVDGLDTPDVVIVAFNDGLDLEHGALVVLDGATGDLHWAVSGMQGGSGPAVADVDADGRPEIIAVTSDGRATALTVEGDELWTSGPLYGVFEQPVVADLDADGIPEVIADRVVLDGATGAEIARIPSGHDHHSIPAIGDLDVDGEQEIVYAEAAYSMDGTQLWSAASHMNVGYDSVGVHSVLIDADGDPEAEIVMLADNEIAMFEHDGTKVWGFERISQDRTAIPCAADFDGDGAPEVAFAAGEVFTVVETNGDTLWSREINDTSGMAACSGYDFNADGAYEVVYADQTDIFVLDGATGDIRLTRSDHASRTLWEYPVIADVDRDGSAEIIVASSAESDDYTGAGGIKVFGHPEGQWPESGAAWPVHDYAVTNIEADGSVPPTPTPSWLAHNVYRARPALETELVDLVGYFADACTSCEPDESVTLEVFVQNNGTSPTTQPVDISLFSEDGGTRTHLETTTLSDMLPPGDQVTVTFDVVVADFGSKLIAVVDTWDTTGECDESNNEAIILVPEDC